MSASIYYYFSFFYQFVQQGMKFGTFLLWHTKQRRDFFAFHRTILFFFNKCIKHFFSIHTKSFPCKHDNSLLVSH